MTLRDIFGLLASHIYASAILALVEGLRRWLGIPQLWTRKLVHVLAGMWVFGILALLLSVPIVAALLVVLLDGYCCNSPVVY
jgi:hypothetical protein